MQYNKLAAGVAAMALAVPGPVLATNGMIMEGYGPIAAAMAYDNGPPRSPTTRPRSA